MKLTKKQVLFCQEYLIDLNATQACIRSGYSSKSAKSIGSENLSKPAIQNEIARLQKESYLKLQITKNEILRELKKLAVPTNNELEALCKFGYKIKDKIKAIELLVNYLNIFEDINSSEYLSRNRLSNEDMKKLVDMSLEARRIKVMEEKNQKNKLI